jgi:uncharacterized membrane protein YbhN (UPF0104 family)
MPAAADTRLTTMLQLIAMKKRVKFLLALLILGVTIVVFIRYASSHPELFETLRRTNPVLAVALITGYLVWFAAVVLTLRFSLKLYDKTMPRQENILLNAYSTLINFFGPGQSGPAFRGLYLKKRHNFPFKKYIFGTLIYYAFYAVISAFLLCVGSRPWWQTTLLVVAAGSGSLIILRLYGMRAKTSGLTAINPVYLGWLFAATVLQAAAQTVIFYAELHSLDASISFAQALTYTGAANLTLFIAITPGAIGIREAFLLFSQQLHHISSAVVVAANVIDRAVYLLFMGLLFILVLGLHAKDKLQLKQLRPENDQL